MREYAYAVCFATNSSSFSVMSTHRTFAAARHKYSCTTGDGFYIAHKIPGYGYMRMTDAEIRTAQKGAR